MNLTIQVRLDHPTNPTMARVWIREEGSASWEGYIRGGIFTQKLPGGREVQRADVWDVRVTPEKRRMGIGTALYDQLERVLGQRLIPSGAISDDALEFWLARNPELKHTELQDNCYGSSAGYCESFWIEDPDDPQ